MFVHRETPTPRPPELPTLWNRPLDFSAIIPGLSGSRHRDFSAPRSCPSSPRRPRRPLESFATAMMMPAACRWAGRPGGHQAAIMAGGFSRATKPGSGGTPAPDGTEIMPVIARRLRRPFNCPPLRPPCPLPDIGRTTTSARTKQAVRKAWCGGSVGDHDGGGRAWGVSGSRRNRNRGFSRFSWKEGASSP